MRETYHYSNKLKTAIAAGMTSIALAACAHTAEAEEPGWEPEIVPVAPAYPTADYKIAPREIDIERNLASSWQEIINGRNGLIDIAVYDNISGAVARYGNTETAFKTASIVKLAVLEELIRTEEGWQWAQANRNYIAPMITQSDNGVTSALWSRIGGEQAMQNYLDLIQANRTNAGSGGYWGATLTTALDQLRVVNTAVYPNVYLSQEKSEFARQLMREVVPDQRWGISGGVPANAIVENKNGWYPHGAGWTMNSIGHVTAPGVDYTIAILTTGDPAHPGHDFEYGRQTSEMLASATWNNLRPI